MEFSLNQLAEEVEAEAVRLAGNLALVVVLESAHRQR